jgi:hypothetical protein
MVDARMHTKLLALYEKAENERKVILSSIAALPEQKFFHRQGNKWSISQILVHLMTAENFSLQYMKKKSLGISQAGDTGLIEDLKFLILKMSQRVPLKYKAPKLLGEDSPKALPLSRIEELWDASRFELKIFLETFQDETLKKKIYKHPVVGRLNIIQAVSFLREHVNHHLPQIRRLLK